MRARPYDPWVDETDRSMLTAYFQKLGLDPIEPTDPMYVDLYEDLALIDDDPVAALADTIELTPGSSTQLLSGYRGAGKTTELLRLKRKLEEMGFVALLIDVEDYLDTSQPVDISEFLIALAGALDDEAVATTSNANWANLHWWDRMADFLGRIKPTGIDFEFPTTGVALKTELKSSSEFTVRLREAMATSLASLNRQVQEFVDDVVKVLLADGGKGVVLLVDSIEHFRGTNTTDGHVQETIERLFGLNAERLQYRNLHIVYTVPPYLKVRLGNLAALYYPGAGLQVIPALKVRDERGEPNPAVLDALKLVLGKRGDWEAVLGSDAVLADRICLMSGGHLRDLLRIMREVLRRARRADGLPVEATLVDQSIAQLAREMLPIAETDAQWLWRIHQDHDSPLADFSDLTGLSRFLDNHLVLCYRNGREWYDVHPLILNDIQAITDRIGTRREHG
jgi:hypothetical protein